MVKMIKKNWHQVEYWPKNQFNVWWWRCWWWWWWWCWRCCIRCRSLDEDAADKSCNKPASGTAGNLSRFSPSIFKSVSGMKFQIFSSTKVAINQSLVLEPFPNFVLLNFFDHQSFCNKNAEKIFDHKNCWVNIWLNCFFADSVFSRMCFSIKNLN